MWRFFKFLIIFNLVAVSQPLEDNTDDENGVNTEKSTTPQSPSDDIESDDEESREVTENESKEKVESSTKIIEEKEISAEAEEEVKFCFFRLFKNSEILI